MATKKELIDDETALDEVLIKFPIVDAASRIVTAYQLKMVSRYVAERMFKKQENPRAKMIPEWRYAELASKEEIAVYEEKAGKGKVLVGQIGGGSAEKKASRSRAKNTQGDTPKLGPSEISED